MPKNTKHCLSKARFTVVFWMCLAIIAGISPCRTAQADEYTVQKRDLRFDTLFEIESNGAPAGTVLRQRWRQPMRAHYVLYGANGTVQGEATTRMWSLGLIFPWATNVDIVDRNGQLTYQLVGDFFTAETARFRLKTAEGDTIALLRVDLTSTGCVATQPENRYAVLARYYRNQVSDFNYERWDFSTQSETPVSAAVWQLIGAVLADVW